MYVLSIEGFRVDLDLAIIVHLNPEELDQGALWDLGLVAVVRFLITTRLHQLTVIFSINSFSWASYLPIARTPRSYAIFFSLFRLLIFKAVLFDF